MKSILLVLALLGPALSPAGEEWWNKDWKFRRPIAINNRLDRALEKGFTMQVEVDPDYLGIREKSKAGLGDWALVRGGVRVPFLLQPGRGKTLLLCFRTAAEIRPGATDGYHLYYGAPEAATTAAPQDQVYDFWEDFSRPEALAERFQADKDLTVAVQDGALVIRDLAPARLPSAPARIAFRNFPALPGFELSFDVEMDSNDAAGAGFAIQVDLKEQGKDDPSIGKKIDELVEKLGDDTWQAREKATKDLIALGRAAVAKLTEAARSTDAEVKWRANHILKEIAEKAPAPLISAGIAGGEPGATVWFNTIIGKNRTRNRHNAGWPVKTRVTLQRDADGDVKILWNGRLPQSGQLPGEVQSVAFAIHKTTANPLGVIRIDNILVRRYVEDDSRPTSMIDIEETRP